jgi:hypothetical protein
MMRLQREVIALLLHTQETTEKYGAEMNVPPEFMRFAEGFYQGSADQHATLEQWIACALARLNVAQKSVLKQFLSDLLAKNVDEAQLQKIWDSTTADYYMMGANGIRSFFLTVRDMIE